MSDSPLLRTAEESKCPLIGDVIHCRCGNPSSHYGTMGVRGAREVRDEPLKRATSCYRGTVGCLMNGDHHIVCKS